MADIGIILVLHFGGSGGADILVVEFIKKCAGGSASGRHVTVQRRWNRSQWQNESKMAAVMDDGENDGVARVLSCFNAPHDSRPSIEERMARVSAICCTNVG